MSQSRSMFMGFAGILTIGFALSGWYVGQRIQAADARPASATAPITTISAGPEPQPEPSDAPPDDGSDIYGLPPGTIP